MTEPQRSPFPKPEMEEISHGAPPVAVLIVAFIAIVVILTCVFIWAMWAIWPT